MASDMTLGELCGELVCAAGDGWHARLKCLATTARNFSDGNPDDKPAQYAAEVLEIAAKRYADVCRLTRVPPKQW
jgi:hypothetical protein